MKTRGRNNAIKYLVQYSPRLHSLHLLLIAPTNEQLLPTYSYGTHLRLQKIPEWIYDPIASISRWNSRRQSTLVFPGKLLDSHSYLLYIYIGQRGQHVIGMPLRHYCGGSVYHVNLMFRYVDVISNCINNFPYANQKNINIAM